MTEIPGKANSLMHIRDRNHDKQLKNHNNFVLKDFTIIIKYTCKLFNFNRSNNYKVKGKGKGKILI